MGDKKKTIRYVISGVIVLIVLGLFFLPVIARNYAVKYSKELIGRQIDMDKLRINYFTGTIKIFGFKMFEADGHATFFSFDTLIVNTVPYKYMNKTISLDQFYLQGLEVNISKKDSIFNFDDLLAFHTAQDSIAKEEAEEFKYQFSNLELRDAALHFDDRDVQKRTSFEDMELLLPYIEWNQEDDSEADFELRFTEGGKLRSTFVYEPQTGNYEGKITLESLQLSPFYDYVAQYANISSLGGVVNTTIAISGNDQAFDNILVSGVVDLSGFEMIDHAGQKFLGSESVRCALEKISYINSTYVISELHFEKPYIKFELDSVSNNLFRIFNVATEEEAVAGGAAGSEQDAVSEMASKQEVAEESSATNTEGAASGNRYYAVKKMTVDQGVLEYTDNLTGQPFDYYLSEIRVGADSIYSDGEWVDLQSDMLLNERGTLKANVGFNPQHPMDLDIDIAIKEFVLSDLNIYSRYYTGHSILNGDMFYFTKSQVTNGQITSENNLLIKNVSVENTKGGLWSLPLKLAVFILKDKNGDIELDVPVRGDLNNPEIDVWDLIGTTLKKKIFDATDNPARSLAKLVDAEPEDLEAILLNYPDTVITEDQQRQLDLILELEGKKEGLGIVMNYVFDPEALLQQDSLTSDSIAPPPRKVAEDTLTIGQEQKAIAAVESRADSTVTTSQSITGDEQSADSLLTLYGRKMVEHMERYLKQKAENTSITVQMAEISDPSAVGATPQFKVKYSLREATEEDENTTSDTLTTKNSTKKNGQ